MSFLILESLTSSQLLPVGQLTCSNESPLVLLVARIDPLLTFSTDISTHLLHSLLELWRYVLIKQFLQKS